MHRIINQLLLVSAMTLQPILGSSIESAEIGFIGIQTNKKYLRRIKKKFGFKFK